MVERPKLPAGLKVLVVEDEYLIAANLCKELSERGVAPVGPFGCLGRALEEVESGRTIDAAILDINIGGRSAYPLADRLVAFGIPFVFGTGYDNWTIPERFLAITRLEKPLDPDTIITNLATLHRCQPAAESWMSCKLSSP
ncbi:response regulator [Pelagibacterium lentulum]|uniref:Response regulator n=1 Tax=Pelagibacterium lentulum TaxID=2029865 RepID=A0A916W267_9HYPH|nr:response regulator [Pelagibacterium lentulum]GGA60322.1 response regulator [Pelagibacterium lentulum]